MLRNLREFWRRRMTDGDGQLHTARAGYERRKGDRRKEDRRKEDRRKEDRRKEELPFDGPDRRRGKDRRQYVRRVMTGEVPLPDQQRRTSS
jgi:hypothetical protein